MISQYTWSFLKSSVFYFKRMLKKSIRLTNGASMSCGPTGRSRAETPPHSGRMSRWLFDFESFSLTKIFLIVTVLNKSWKFIWNLVYFYDRKYSWGIYICIYLVMHLLKTSDIRKKSDKDMENIYSKIKCFRFKSF